MRRESNGNGGGDDGAHHFTASRTTHRASAAVRWDRYCASRRRKASSGFDDGDQRATDACHRRQLANPTNLLSPPHA